MLSPLLHSLIVATVATIIAFLIALPFAYWDVYYPYRGKKIVEIIFLLPLVLPPTIVGFYLLQLFGRYGVLGQLLEQVNFSLIFTLQGATLATVIVILPLIFQGLKGAFAAVPKNLIAVAKTLSANRREVLWRVILPNCWHSLVASIILAFCRGLGEFGASLMVAGFIEGKTDTLATAIYFAVQQGNQNLAYTLSFINVVIGIILLLFIQLLTYYQKRSF
ncbi:molybdate ABC transporter permease subunit [Enterococcus sp. MJM12]|uniref:Molybdenum transport system permease n=1 Tax=Candidatus Enterococcus myersii TaxID=2815322 RepID=A0ABS3HAD9_9ENTE|nr:MULTISPECIES: molybdate ABC transporter permease subunit [Enterococcus]MBO0450417.1 molybdate ABC transporter permease subunit [Enterococcus sp. MJM12]MDT2739493.1 molybdate ABC transporter permease subunit [Enterococcus canintestini]WHA09945.1 molybdate ABC transporter permease subunit [Enterococcus montenegrensis]